MDKEEHSNDNISTRSKGFQSLTVSFILHDKIHELQSEWVDALAS